MAVLELTRTLVSIPSHEDETAAGDALADWLREHTDATVRRDDVGNVFARRGGGDPSLALVGHHDVVPPAPGQRGEDTYAIEERDGRLYGRGTADMKGSLAAAAVAFRDAAPTGTLVLASFVGEERGGLGAQHAVDAGFAPDAAVVLEGSTGYSAPGVTDVAVAHKGRRGSTVTATGVSAHASEPDAGENAIYRALEAIALLRDLPRPSVRVAGESLEASVAVTEIEGGTAMNVVPDRCTLTVDERTVPGETLPIDRLESLEGVSWTIDGAVPPMRCEDETLQTAALEAASSAQCGRPAPIAKPHATDAGWLARAGTDCVICGAAEPGEAHTAEESVSIAVLERCVDIYRGLAERWT